MKPLRVFPPPRVSAAPREPLPFPLDRPACHLFSRGRHALWSAATALGLGPRSVVLAPAYHHGSEIEALVRAGAQARFYETGQDLAPKEEELERLLGPDVRALLLIHVLGFPQDAPRWRRWCDEHGLLLIEDCAQAWLSDIDGEPVGTWGDVAVYCLYKTVATFDGAALLLRGGETVGTPAASREGLLWPLAVASRPALWLRGRRAPVITAELELEDLSLGDPTAPITALTSRMLPRLVGPGIKDARRARYERLVDALGEWVPPPFDRLPPGACPLALLVEAPEREELLRGLAEREIEPLPFWAVPHPSLPAAEFPAAIERRQRSVALPVHQDLSDRDFDRIVTTARGLLAGVAGG